LLRCGRELARQEGKPAIILAGKGKGKGSKKGLAVSEALLVLFGGAGRDRTDGLMNAMRGKGGVGTYWNHLTI
jgi:hypothetical protein